MKAVLYKKLKNKMVKCLACSHYCTIPENGVGICGVRKNIRGDLHLLVYGKAAAVNIDPIEKKPLFHFLPGTQIFSLGTFGCNFGCLFCQNWDISQPTREIRFKPERDKEIERLLDVSSDFSPKYIVEYSVKNNIPSIAYTYNEPAIFFEYAYDTAKLAKDYGIKNVFVSNGYESDEALKKIKKYLDAINIDLKSFSEDFYRDICKARLEPVLKNIEKVFEMGIWEEVTTLIIPRKNDSDKELKQIAEFLVSIDKSIPWHVTAFHPEYKMLDTPPTPKEILYKAYKIGKKAGLKYVYVGNIFDNKYENTICPKCKKTIIVRNGYLISNIKIKNGKCEFCNEKIEGVWS